MTSYSSAQKRYLSFCETYNLPPLPLSESVTCLFAAFLAHQGLKSQSVSVYLSALRHLQITAGLPATWPRLKYVLKGIARVQPLPSARRLPITAAIMLRLQAGSTVTADVVEAHVGSMPFGVHARPVFALLKNSELQFWLHLQS